MVFPASRLPTAPARQPACRRAGGRAGFTLFEVGISLVLVAFGVISVIILFPIGIKAQEASRYKIYAACMAEQYVESYNTAHNANPAFELEAPNAWDVHVTGRNMAPDLEARCSSFRFGMYPLPLTIAQRLDSDNDEIQSVLSQGGYVYYPQPLANTGLTDTGFINFSGTSQNRVGGMINGSGMSTINATQANDAQKVIMAVEGYAQNNALYAFPQKAWPYYTGYPSPPIINSYNNGGNIWLAPGMTQTQWAWGQGKFYMWEDVGVGDPDVRGVWSNTWPVPATLNPIPMKGQTAATTFPANTGGLRWHLGLGAYAGGGPSTTTACLASATGYFACALWYAQRKGLDTLMGGRFFNGTATLGDVAALFASPPTPSATVNFAWQVNALRYLANAATAVSGYWETGKPSEAIPSLTFTAGGSSPSGINLTPVMIINYHEMCMAVGARFCASYPYDWGSPRMLQRAIMMDNPLIEYDLLQPGKMLTGTLADNGSMANAWRPIAPQPIRNLGLSATYPGWSLKPPMGSGGQLVSENMLDATMVPNVPAPLPYPANPLWGDGQNDFTLNAPFNAADRCRQLVFWTVDWQSYEDCETAPSAPVDAGKYMISAPFNNGGGFNFRIDNPGFMAWQQFGYMNPEKGISWPQDVSAISTGSPLASIGLGNAGNQSADAQVQGLGNAKLFNGLFGADRNFNGKLDRGPLSKSVRLRAVQLARFNYYDLRVPAPIR